MLGKPGDGWRVSLTTLMNERVSIGGAIPPKGQRHRSATSSRRGRTLPEDRKDPARARRGDEAVVPGRGASRLTNIRASQNRKMGDPGPGGVDRQDGVGRAQQGRSTNLVVDLMGAEGMLYGSYEMIRPEHGDGLRHAQKAFLRMPGQLDRGRHDRGDEEHPRRAGARSARRRARRPRRPVERGPAQLSLAGTFTGTSAGRRRDRSATQVAPVGATRVAIFARPSRGSGCRSDGLGHRRVDRVEASTSALQVAAACRPSSSMVVIVHLLGAERDRQRLPRSEQRRLDGPLGDLEDVGDRTDRRSST